MVVVALCIAVTTPGAETPSLPIDAAKAACLTERDTLATIARDETTPCLALWETVATVGPRTLYRARYAAASPESDDDAHRLVTEVLYEGVANTDRVTTLWMLQQDENFYFLKRVTVHKVDSRHVIEVFGCANGTGGCGQDFVRWTPGEPAREIAKGVRATFDHVLPAGYRTLKSPQLDLDTLMIEGYGWRDGKREWKSFAQDVLPCVFHRRRICAPRLRDERRQVGRRAL
jgi:hypothetical protein